jgi:hypothetical protein
MVWYGFMPLDGFGNDFGDNFVSSFIFLILEHGSWSMLRDYSLYIIMDAWMTWNGWHGMDRWMDGWMDGCTQLSAAANDHTEKIRDQNYDPTDEVQVLHDARGFCKLFSYDNPEASPKKKRKTEKGETRKIRRKKERETNKSGVGREVFTPVKQRFVTGR